MSHSSISLPERLNIRWWFIACMAIVAVGCGFVGMVRYYSDHKEPVDYASAFYHSLQLLILHAPHMDGPLNWPLHVGRFLAALVFFWTALCGLTALFRTDFRLRNLRRRGGHVIICGVGRLGRQLAAEFRAAGTPVVAIEANPERAAALAHSGALLLNGDACTEKELVRAGVSRAAQLIAVCEGVQNNVAIVALAGELLSKQPYRSHSRRQLESWLFVADASLRDLFKSEELFPHVGDRYRVNVRGLDIFSLAARQALLSNPLDYDRITRESETVVHLVIVGFGTLGQHVALQAVRSGHFANQKKLKVTILERGHGLRYQGFLKAFPQFAELANASVVEFFPTEIDAVERILQAARPIVKAPPDASAASGDDAAARGQSKVAELVTVVLCWDWKDGDVLSEEELFGQLERDDATNVQLALNLHSLCVAKRIPMPRTLLLQSRASGFAALFNAPSLSQLVGGQLRIVGTIEQTCSLDAIMHETTDAIARALHEQWCDEQFRAGRKQGDKPALWPWDQLDESYKEANRQAADHIPIKARAANWTIDILHDSPRRLVCLDGPQYSAEVELLAEMEHARWNAYMALRGYKYASGDKADDVNRTHPCLLPWNKLSESAKEYDRSQILAMPKALERAELGVYLP
jgi:voltage-gated potassium channel Kch